MKALELLKSLPSQETVCFFQQYQHFEVLEIQYINENFQFYIFVENLKAETYASIYIKNDFAELREKFQAGDEITVKIEKDLVVSNGKLDICFKAMEQPPEINWKESEPLASLHIRKKDWHHLKAAAKIAKLNEVENVESPILQNINIEACGSSLCVRAISKNYVTERLFHSAKINERNYLRVNIPANAIIEADKLSPRSVRIEIGTEYIVFNMDDGLLLFPKVEEDFPQMEELDQKTLEIAKVDVKKIRSALTKATGKNEIAPNDKQTVHITINNSGTLIIQGDKGSTNISTSSKGVDIKMEVRASLFSEAIRFIDSGKVLLSLPSVIKNTLVFGEVFASVRNWLHGVAQKAHEFKDSIAPESKEVEVPPLDSPDDPSAITPNSEVD